MPIPCIVLGIALKLQRGGTPSYLSHIIVKVVPGKLLLPNTPVHSAFFPFSIVLGPSIYCSLQLSDIRIY
jgi:hypothetical protein